MFLGFGPVSTHDKDFRRLEQDLRPKTSVNLRESLKTMHWGK